MFKSKLRPVAIPQFEHEKLVGTLALLWGNAVFELPPVPFASFLTGIGLHDRAYRPPGQPADWRGSGSGVAGQHAQGL